MYKVIGALGCVWSTLRELFCLFQCSLGNKRKKNTGDSIAIKLALTPSSCRQTQLNIILEEIISLILSKILARITFKAGHMMRQFGSFRMNKMSLKHFIIHTQYILGVLSKESKDTTIGPTVFKETNYSCRTFQGLPT